MKVTKTMVLFWSSIFSQWYIRKNLIKENGITYSSAEQYMMYQKALLFEDKEIAEEIMKTDDVKVIKNLGRKVKGFDDEVWNQNKEAIIVNGNYLKFSQNKDLLKKILEHKDKEFVEGSPVDCVYGIGLHWNDELALDKKNWKGENLLGKALTKVCALLSE